jgi:hypothetical protein
MKTAYVIGSCQGRLFPLRVQIETLPNGRRRVLANSAIPSESIVDSSDLYSTGLRIRLSGPAHSQRRTD